MAFDNVTFFELHLDDARFGGERVEPSEEIEVASPESGRPVLPLAFLVLLGVGAAVTARRMRRGSDLDVDLEEAEAIAVE